jgi:hypothetical protein
MLNRFVPAPVPAIVLALAAFAAPVFSQELPTDPRLAGERADVHHPAP